MSASDENHTQQDAARRRDAIADMQERLTQFSRTVGRARDGLPEQHADALSRIEQEIGSLGERIAAFSPEGQSRERGDASSAPAAPPEADNPWDPQSAEALMQAYELAEAQFTAAGPEAELHRRRQWPREVEAEAPPAHPAYDQPWLEARFADIAALLQRALADTNSGSALAALDRRLDQFERRLDSALSDMALGPDGEGLKLIDAHVAELAEHVDAIRQQLGRLDAMDGQLCELTRTLEERQPPAAGPAPLGEDAVAALVDSAAERAASLVAASLPAQAGGPGPGDGRIEALEALLQDYIAERRRSDEVSAGILHTIEDALVRILDRVEAMEAANSSAQALTEGDARDSDAMEAETDRLAEAYAAGARVLGQQLLEPSLHAADYVATDRREEPTEMPLDMLPQLAADEPAPLEEEQTRQELRASALRAKLKAQATHQEPPTTGDAGLDQPADRERRARARAGQVVDVGASGQPPLQPAAGRSHGCAVRDGLHGGQLVPRRRTAHRCHCHAAAHARGAARAEADKSDLAPSSDGWKVQPAPVPQPALRRPTPDAATDDSAQPQPAPTRRLYRLQTGTAALPPTGATPVMLSSQNAAGASSAGTGATMADAEAEIPSTVATPKMRQAAAAGDAFAQFEIATRFAEGKGVAQDHGQAFAWYERAATRGLAAAQFRLAAYYERGLGVEPDKERAKVWYIRAADQGYVRAMHNLGVLTVGTGERQADYLAASRWFRQAADRGLADSQFNLAILYENGRGVQKSLPEAYKWFALAARSGDAVAARRLEQVRTRLTAAELDAAEEKIATWSPVASEPITGSIGRDTRR